MPKRIFFENLPTSATRDEVQNLCAQYGQIQSVSLSCGSGYIEFARDAEADAAIQALNRKQYQVAP